MRYIKYIESFSIENESSAIDKNHKKCAMIAKQLRSIGYDVIQTQHYRGRNNWCILGDNKKGTYRDKLILHLDLNNWHEAKVSNVTKSNDDTFKFSDTICQFNLNDENAVDIIDKAIQKFHRNRSV